MIINSRIFRFVCLAVSLFGFSTLKAQKEKLPQAIAPYFVKAMSVPSQPNADGFIQRWLLLEPIPKPIKSNIIFTDSYLKEAFATQYYPGQATALPKDGTTVKVGKEKLKWHALDSKLYNVKLFRFATSFNKPKYGVMFWAATVIDSPEEMQNVRLAVGSNGASMWWLNGEDVVMLEGDRRMVKDDVLSKRITLKKGRNILHGAVVNGPGMSDFCVRFVDEHGNPIKNIKISVK